MTYADIIKAIEQEAPIENVKQWHKHEPLYILVRCPNTALFNELSERFNHIVPDDREKSEYILITRRM